MACGDNGDGRMAEPQTIVDFALNYFVPSTTCPVSAYLLLAERRLKNFDDARFITNFSSGKMGSAVVSAALSRGAEVTVILGRHTAEIDKRAQIIDVTTTQQMYDETVKRVDESDIIIMAGAPCDYRPEKFSESKIKEENLTVSFVKIQI